MKNMGTRLGCEAKYFQRIKYVVDGTKRMEDRSGFMNYAGTSDFDTLLKKKLATRIQKQDTFLREAMTSQDEFINHF